MPVTIERFLDPWEAHVVKARLVAEGIDASVSNDQLSMIEWPISYALGGTALAVPEEDVERARDVLAAYHRGDFERDLVEAGHVDPPTDDTCTCGHHVMQIAWSQRLLVMLLGGFFLATFPTRTTGRCRTCGRLCA